MVHLHTPVWRRQQCKKPNEESVSGSTRAEIIVINQLKTLLIPWLGNAINYVWFETSIKGKIKWWRYKNRLWGSDFWWQVLPIDTLFLRLSSRGQCIHSVLERIKSNLTQSPAFKIYYSFRILNKNLLSKVYITAKYETGWYFSLKQNKTNGIFLYILLKHAIKAIWHKLRNAQTISNEQYCTGMKIKKWKIRFTTGQKCFTRLLSTEQGFGKKNLPALKRIKHFDYRMKKCWPV